MSGGGTTTGHAYSFLSSATSAQTSTCPLPTKGFTLQTTLHMDDQSTSVGCVTLGKLLEVS